MISIPMLLTRRGWLGWATPYFLSLFVRLASLHALTDRDLLAPARPPSVPLAIYFIQLYFKPALLLSPCVLQSSIVPSRARGHIPQVPVCKIVFSPIVRWMVIDIWKCLLTSFAFNREDCSNIEESYAKNAQSTSVCYGTYILNLLHKLMILYFYFSINVYFNVYFSNTYFSFV